MATEGATGAAPTASEYIVHHLGHANTSGKPQQAIIDFTIINLDTVFWSIVTGLLSAYAFGLVFSISWTPCVGAFLGSALMLASRSGSAAQGALLLLCYSAGLGIPFVLSALLIDRLKGAFDWIKRNYGVITRASGLLLVLIGLAMAFGLLGRLLALLS